MYKQHNAHQPTWSKDLITQQMRLPANAILPPSASWQHPAMCRLQPAMTRDEVGLLLAFDNNRAAIYTAATKAFNRERKGSYELAATDF